MGKRILIGLVGVVAILIGLAGAGIGILETPWGKRELAAALGKTLSSPGETVTIAGLAGFVPFDDRIGNVTFADPAGPRLVIDDARATLAAGDLLRGRVTLVRLAARSIEVRRPSAQSGSSMSPAALLNPPLPVAIETLEIGSLALGAPVLGTPLALRVQGSLEAGDGRARVAFALDQSGGDGRISLDASYDGARLTVDATASEPGGRLVAALLRRAAPLSLAASVKGAGPLDDWQGTLTLAAGSEAQANARVTIAGDEPRRVTVAADASVAALLPASLRPLAQGPIAIDAAATIGKDGIALDRLEIAGPERVSAHGRFVPATGAVSGTAQVALATLSPLAELAGVPLSGSAALAATVAGTVTAPNARLTLDAQNLGLLQGRVARAHLELTTNAAPAAPVALEASGTFDGIAAPSLPPEFGREAAWRLKGRIDPRAATVALDSFALSDASVSVTGAASGSKSGTQGTLALALADLRPFDQGELGGAVRAAADFHVGADGAGIATLSGTLAGPSGPPRLVALLGRDAKLSATIERGAGGAIAARDLVADLAAGHASGSATRGADGRIEATVTAALPRLGVLDPGLSGSATLTAHVEGRADALQATLALDAPALAFAGRRIDGFAAALDVPSLAPLAGRLDAHGAVAGVPLAAHAAASLSGGKVSVSGIELTGAGARITGDVTLAGTRITGTLDGALPNLAPFSPLAGTKLAGSATLRARANGGTAEMTLTAAGLGAFGMTARQIHLAAALRNPLTEPQGNATLSVADAALGGARVDALEVTAKSAAQDRAMLAATAHGFAGETFALALGGSAALTKAGFDVGLDRFSGNLGATPLRLTAPLAASSRGGTIRFEGLALDVDGGTLTGDGTLGPQSLSLDIRARGLPVHALAALAGKEAEGTLGFEATLGGTRRAPTGIVTVDAEKLRLAPADEAGPATLGLSMRALWRDGRVALQGRLAAPRGAALNWRGSAPLVLAAQGFAPAMPENGALEFQLQGNGDLGAIADLLPLGEDRLQGQLAVDVSVSGTIAHPDAKGRLSLANGRYENLASGAVLSGVHFALVGDRDRLDLTNFAANDGGSGTLDLKGAVDLAALPPRFELQGRLNHFRALRRDEGTGIASGSFTLAGSIAAPRLSASLTIDEADLTVPEKLAPNLTPVAATEINSANGTVLTPKTAPQAAPLASLALDVTIALPGRTFVRGRGLDSEWRGRIAVGGTTAAPVLKGHLDVVHGTFSFLGVTFVLAQGAIDFPGGKSIDPVIDIRSTAQSSDITAIVDISGTATQPTIKLSSEPALPRDEILSRLLFGTSMSQMSPAEGLELASAAAQLAGGQSLDVLGKLRGGLGLDRLSLGSSPNSVVPGVNVPSLQGAPGETGAGPATGLGTTPLAPGAAGGVAGTALNAGKYVANGVYVGVSQGVGSGSSTATVQVDVSRHITLDTETGEASGTGVGVEWKLDY